MSKKSELAQSLLNSVKNLDQLIKGKERYVNLKRERIAELENKLAENLAELIELREERTTSFQKLTDLEQGEVAGFFNGYPAIYNESIDILFLDNVSRNGLLFNNIRYIGDLMQMTAAQIYFLDRIGERSARFIIEALERHNLVQVSKVNDWKRPE